MLTPISEFDASVGEINPSSGECGLKTLRGLMAFAVTEGLIDADPTIGVKLGKVKDTGGFATWGPEHVEQYRAHHSLGTRPRLAIELGLWHHATAW